MRVLVGYTNQIPEIAEGRPLPGRERQEDSIVAFGAGYASLGVTPDMAWKDILARCPPGWRPDVYIHWSPEYNPIPQGLESADCLTVGVWGDWNLGGQAMRAVSSLFDVLVADQAGCERLRGMGYENVLHGLLWAFDPAKQRRLNDGAEKRAVENGAEVDGECRHDIDILMIGNFNHALQRERAPWLARVAALSDRYRVMLTSGLFDDVYVQAMNRAKIVFNRSIRGEANMRAYEAPACGALMFYEAANLEIHAIYEDRRHCVLYDAANLEDLLAYYLAPEHRAERLQIAQAGWERVQSHSYARHFAGLLDKIEPLLATRRRSFDRFSATQQQMALATHWLLTSNANVYHKTDALLNSLAAAAERAREEPATQPERQASDSREAACIAGLHAVLCGEMAHCAAAPGYKRKRMQASLSYARQAVQRAPGHLGAQFNLATLTLAVGNTGEAETLLRELATRLEGEAENFDNSATTTDMDASANEAWRGLGEPMFPRRFNWFDVAWEWLHGELSPNSLQGRQQFAALLAGRAHLTLAEIAHGRGQYTLSALRAEQATHRLPGIGEAQYALATALRAQGRSSEAVAAYRRALALAPFHVAARDELARLLLDTQRAGEAVEALNAWLAILNGCPIYAELRPAVELLHRQAQRQAQQERQAGQNGASGQNGQGGREKRLLALPDWRRPASWQTVVQAFARAYMPADPVLLMLRADPNDCPDAQALLARLEQFVTHDLNCRPDALPNITLLHQPLVPADGWKLMQAADAVLSDNLTTFWRELAQSACVPILECADLGRHDTEVTASARS